MKTICDVKRKTDKDDALKLARMAAMRELTAVHTPNQQHREFRSLVKYRKTLDGRINKTKNTIRVWFVNQGITIAARLHRMETRRLPDRAARREHSGIGICSDRTHIPVKAVRDFATHGVYFVNDALSSTVIPSVRLKSCE